MRLFVAISLSQENIDRLAALGAAAAHAGFSGRYVRPESLHMTLRFLGEVDAQRLPELMRALDACGEARAFTLRFDRAGDFSSRDGRTVWVGAAAHAGLAALYDTLQQSLEGAGFGREARALKPHITLARAADAGCAPALRERLIPFEQRCGGLRLYSSQLSAAGPSYTLLHECMLRGE